jgi:membrane protease YdiL (CAAX protease family)
MTQPTPPLDFLPVEPSPPKRWPGIAAWCIIWLTVLYLMIGTILPQLRGKTAAAGTSDAQIELVGKYVVGMSEVTRSATTQPASQGAILIEQLDPLVKSNRNHLQAAAIAGEVLGAQAAIHRLDKVDAKSLTEQERAALQTLSQIYTDGAASVEAESAQALERDLGFTGRLAMSFGRPDDQPPRSEVLAHAKRVAIIFAGALVGGAVALAVGAVLLVVGIVLIATGVLKRYYAAPAPVHTVFVEMFAVYLLSFLVLSFVLSLIFGGSAPLSISWLLSAVLPIAIVYGLRRGLTWNEMRTGLGWHGGKGWYIEIPLGIAGYLAGLPVVAVGFVITLLLIRLTGQTPSHPIQGESAGSVLGALQLYGIASVWAPIIEETMFRGALFHHMRRRWNWFISAGVVAFIFAAIHPQGWATIPVLGSIAMVLAALREWRGSILASMTAHACNNFVMVSLLIATK